MQQHMLAAIDEQIFACQKELSVLTGNEWICSRVPVSRKDTLDLETIYQMLESYVAYWESFGARFETIKNNPGPGQRLGRAELLYEANRFMQQLEELKTSADAGSKAYLELSTNGAGRNMSIVDQWYFILEEIDEYIETVKTSIPQLSTYINYEMHHFIRDMSSIQKELDKCPDILKKCKTGSWIPFKTKPQSIAEALQFADGVKKELALLRQDTEYADRKLEDEIQRLTKGGHNYTSKSATYGQWSNALTRIETAENEIRQFQLDVIALEKN
jgi:hypothetical protein